MVVRAPEVVRAPVVVEPPDVVERPLVVEVVDPPVVEVVDPPLVVVEPPLVVVDPPLVAVVVVVEPPLVVDVVDPPLVVVLVELPPVVVVPVPVVVDEVEPPVVVVGVVVGSSHTAGRTTTPLSRAAFRSFSAKILSRSSSFSSALTFSQSQHWPSWRTSMIFTSGSGSCAGHWTLNVGHVAFFDPPLARPFSSV